MTLDLTRRMCAIPTFSSMYCILTFNTTKLYNVCSHIHWAWKTRICFCLYFWVNQPRRISPNSEKSDFRLILSQLDFLIMKLLVSKQSELEKILSGNTSWLASKMNEVLKDRLSFITGSNEANKIVNGVLRLTELHYDHGFVMFWAFSRRNLNSMIMSSDCWNIMMEFLVVSVIILSLETAINAQISAVKIITSVRAVWTKASVMCMLWI